MSCGPNESRGHKWPLGLTLTTLAVNKFLHIWFSFAFFNKSFCFPVIEEEHAIQYVPLQITLSFPSKEKMSFCSTSSLEKNLKCRLKTCLLCILNRTAGYLGGNRIEAWPTNGGWTHLSYSKLLPKMRVSADDRGPEVSCESGL